MAAQRVAAGIRYYNGTAVAGGMYRVGSLDGHWGMGLCEDVGLVYIRACACGIIMCFRQVIYLNSVSSSKDITNGVGGREIISRFLLYR